MAVTIKASKQGLEKVEQARKKKGWAAKARVWCDCAKTSESTLKRFRQGEAIQEDAFKNICQAVGLNWEEIVDDSPPSLSSQFIWLVEVEADDKLVDAIYALIKQHSQDGSLKIRKIERRSLVLVLEGSLEGYERIEYLFRNGQLREILGVPILEVRLAPINLSQWLQNIFEAGWETAENILGREKAALAFSSRRMAKVIRCKLIDLGMAHPFALIVVLTAEDELQRNILLQVYPTEDKYLPLNLQLIVLDDSGKPVLDELGVPLVATATRTNNYIQLLLYGKPGEGFHVKIVLGDASAEEDFLI